MIKAVEKKKAFDEEVFFNESRMYENEWVNPSNRINYNEGGDGIKLARQIYKKYAKEIIIPCIPLPSQVTLPLMIWIEASAWTEKFKQKHIKSNKKKCSFFVLILRCTL